LVKIGRVDPEYSLLKSLFLKEKKEINASRTYYDPRGMHAHNTCSLRCLQ